MLKNLIDRDLSYKDFQLETELTKLKEQGQNIEEDLALELFDDETYQNIKIHRLKKFLSNHSARHLKDHKKYALTDNINPDEQNFDIGRTPDPKDEEALHDENWRIFTKIDDYFQDILSSIEESNFQEFKYVFSNLEEDIKEARKKGDQEEEEISKFVYKELVVNFAGDIYKNILEKINSREIAAEFFNYFREIHFDNSSFRDDKPIFLTMNPQELRAYREKFPSSNQNNILNVEEEISRKPEKVRFFLGPTESEGEEEEETREREQHHRTTEQVETTETEMTEEEMTEEERERYFGAEVDQYGPSSEASPKDYSSFVEKSPISRD